MLKSTRIWHESFLYSSHPSRLKKKRRKKEQICLDEGGDGGGEDREETCCRRLRGSSSHPSLFTSLNVFKNNDNMNMIVLFGCLLLLLLPQSGNGLHPPQCQWSLYQDIERLNCLVESGNNNNLIVEEEVYGIGPEHAKSLWIECRNDVESGGGGGSARDNNNNYNNPEAFHYDNPNTEEDYHNSRGGSGGVGGDSGDNQQNNNNNDNIGYVLSHGVFMAVPNLRDLKLEHCRIAGITPGALSYLPYLQNLTIRAHTSLTWPSSSASLDIKPGVFRGLPDLRHLDLSTTSLLQLPNDFLCFLPSLTYLNLSASYLRDFRSIGITPTDPTNPQNCGNELVVLDLSANHFTLLPPATFAAVPKLEELRIEGNSITIAAERALLGLTHLKVFSLAGNQLTSLPPEFFKDNRQLKEIYLQNNTLGVLAPGLFNGLVELVVLDLSHNELTSEWVNGETFRSLLRLVVLRLDHNALTKIDSLLLRDLSSLQVLNLENNQITHIAEDGFSGMHNIHTLLLSHNHLTTIDNFVCNGLFVLSFLAMDNNKIDRVEPESFKNCSNSLLDLNLSGNKLTAIPTGISVLSVLKTLDLGENKIVDISNASYLWKNLASLYGLRLTDNSISTVQANSFLNLPSLKIVNLAKNNITSIETGVFDNNSNLQAIRLDSNRLKDITGLFKNIPNLLWLNISGNSLEDLHYTDFPPRLQWLDLRSNKIHTLGSCLDVEKLRIRNLDLSHNYLTQIGSSNLPDSIETLILSHNEIHNVASYAFYRKTNISKVDLSHNKLRQIDENAFRLSPGRNTNNGGVPIVEILLGNNPLQCDCTMEWLQSMSSLSVNGQYPIIKDGMDVKCSLSFDRIYEPVSYLNIASSQFLCKYESHCFSVCNCCDFSACDCAMNCPQNCSCYHDQAWGTNLVDCSNIEQPFIPGRIPMDVTELYLDGSLLPSLESHSFIGRKNLKALFLNASRVEIIQNRTFSGLKKLVSLHLEGNYLQEIRGYEFEDLESLEELYLHQNSISWIANGTFAMLTKLRVLWLHGNNFVDLAIWETVASVRLTLNDLTLRGNEWSCDCSFTTQFKDWLIENADKISDAREVHCVDQVSGGKLVTNNSTTATTNSASSSSTELVVVRILDQRNHRCSQSTDLSIREPSSGNSSSDMSVYVVLIVSVVLILIVIVFVGAYFMRQNLRVWFHSHCGLRLNGCSEPPAERDKLFDVFVTYSSKDEAWVRQILAQELEQNDKYRLCLRFRDLPGLTSSNYIADTIVQASEASRRTILVLSHHFLKGDWSRSEVKSAHHSLLKPTTNFGSSSPKVIIILLGQLESKELDQDIRLYIKSHTTLHAEDKRFWAKLKYNLPDVKVNKAPNGRGGGGLHGRTNSSHSYSHAPHPPPHHHHNVRSSQPPPIPVPLPPVNSSMLSATTGGRPGVDNHIGGGGPMLHHQQHQQLLLQQQQQHLQQQQHQLQQQQQHHHHNNSVVSGGGTNNLNLNSSGSTITSNAANGGSVTRPPQRHPNRHVAIHI